MDYRWAQIESWHAVHPNRDRTMCGLDLTEQDVSAWRDTLPNAKSCENCLRIIGRSVDVEEKTWTR